MPRTAAEEGTEPADSLFASLAGAPEPRGTRPRSQRYAQPGRAVGDRVFNGSIDDAAVFSYPLTFDQINVLYGTGLGSIQKRTGRPFCRTRTASPSIV